MRTGWQPRPRYGDPGPPCPICCGLDTWPTWRLTEPWRQEQRRTWAGNEYACLSCWFMWCDVGDVVMTA